MRWDRYVPGAEVFHATEHLLIPLSPKIRRVITVHDLIFKRFPEHHKRLNSLYLNTAMPLYLRQADHIIAVSHCTKSDIVNDYGIDPAKVSVIYEAAAPFFKPPSPERILDMREKFGLWGRYLVTVGTIEPRKNLNRLVQAFVILRERDPDLRLVVVGVDGWLFESFYNEIKDIHPHGTVFRPGYVTDEDLPAMIAGASCAVTPSLYEGFGLPVLEAMACGTPVVCSRTSSLGEIAGDAAVLIDPESLESLTEGLRQVLMDDDFAASLREKGLKRAAEFSWGRAARETWQVYQGPGMTR
jgi:glycosyltransferase involved in cell wall biosynthesis